MEFNKEEFDSLTQKLEQYAAQLSTLQTKLELQPEIESMKNEVACLRQKLDVVTAERDELAEKYEAEHQRCEELDNQVTTAMVENAWLKNYIILSAEKIREFMMKLKSIDRWAFLRSFVTWVIPEELRNEELELVEEVMALPPESPKGVVMNQPTFQGPMYDITGNDSVNIGGDGHAKE